MKTMTKDQTRIMAEPGKLEIMIEREVDAPRELVFRAYTEAEFYAQWLGPRGLTVAVIPETLARTTLGKAKTGQCVNVENDIVVKAVRRHLDVVLGRQQSLTVDKLRQMGF